MRQTLAGSRCRRSGPLTLAVFVTTITSMNHEFDPDKDAINQQRHGMSLAEAEGFEWDTAVVREDRRYHYDEQRFEVTGFIGNRLCVMVLCWRDETTRVISLRDADNREKRNYVRIFNA